MKTIFFDILPNHKLLDSIQRSSLNRRGQCADGRKEMKSIMFVIIDYEYVPYDVWNIEYVAH